MSKNLMQTHVNRIQKVINALRMRQKLNEKRTQLILCEENQKKVDEVIALLSDARNALKSIQ